MILIKDLIKEKSISSYTEELTNELLSFNDDIVVDIISQDQLCIVDEGEDIKDICSTICFILIGWGFTSFSISIE